MPDFSTQPCNCIQRDTQKISAKNKVNFAGISSRKATHSYLAIAVLVTVMSPASTNGQTRFDHARTHDSVRGVNVDSNIMQSLRFLTTRATITVQGRDQGRFLTVFETPIHGYVEFGFPTSQRRPLGSLEMFDITSLAARPYPPGVRKVVISHSCSNLYLTVDKYGQARACQLSDGKSQVSALNRNTHCVDGHKFHVCTDTPHIYLDSLSNKHLPNSTQSPNTKKTYKMRFEKPSTKARHKKILYAVVTRGTWELKLRAQNGVIKRGVIAACVQLWQKSIHLLFQRVVKQRKSQQRERNSRLASVCDINPALIKEEIARSVNANDFTVSIHQAWRHHAVLNLLGTSMPWSHMSERHKNVISVVASRTVRNFLVNSLLQAADMECLSNSMWGKMPPNERRIRLDRTLTLSWLNLRVGSHQVVLENIEKYLHARTTSFIINENG